MRGVAQRCDGDVVLVGRGNHSREAGQRADLAEAADPRDLRDDLRARRCRRDRPPRRGTGRSPRSRPCLGPDAVYSSARSSRSDGAASVAAGFRHRWIARTRSSVGAPVRRAEPTSDLLGSRVRVGVRHPLGDEGVGEVGDRRDRDRRALDREPDVGRTTLQRAELLVTTTRRTCSATGGSPSTVERHAGQRGRRRRPCCGCVRRSTPPRGRRGRTCGPWRRVGARDRPGDTLASSWTHGAIGKVLDVSVQAARHET